MKLCTTDYIFTIKQDDTCDYNPLCFMPSGMMLDKIIMNIFIQSTNKSTTPHQKHFFFRFKDDAIQLCKLSMQEITYKRKNADTKSIMHSHHYIEIEKLRKYISGILHIKNIKADLEKKVDEFINDKTTLITHISLIPTFYLYPIYRKKNN